MEQNMMVEQQAGYGASGAVQKMKALAGSVWMLIIAIACTVTTLLSLANFVLTSGVFDKRVEMSILDYIIPLIPVMLNASLAGATWQFFASKNKPSLIAFAGATKKIRGVITVYQIVAVLIFLAVLVIFALLSFVGGAISSAADSMAGADSTQFGELSKGIAVVIMGVILAAGILVFYFFGRIKKVLRDVYQRSKGQAAMPVSMGLLIVMMFVVGIVYALITGFSSMIGGMLPGALGELTNNAIPEEAQVQAKMIVTAISVLNGIAGFVPFVFGAIVLIKYRAIVKEEEERSFLNAAQQ